VIGGICLLSLGGLELVERLVPADTRQQHNDVAGFIYATLGVIYAVLLALVVIAVWEKYQAADATVEQEANALAEIFWLAHRLPEPEGSHIQELARSYAAEEVVHKEYPLMEQGSASSRRSPHNDFVPADDISSLSPARYALRPPRSSPGDGGSLIPRTNCRPPMYCNRTATGLIRTGTRRTKRYPQIIENP
jgi:hypothetical protein